MANFFSKLFQKDQPTQQNLDMFHDIGNNFSNWNFSAYENDVYRGAVDSIARNTAKLKPTHTIENGTGNADFNQLLQNRPNKYMNTYDLLYKVVTHYFIYNNSFIYIQRDYKGNPEAFYPIRSNAFEFGTNHKDELFMRFKLSDGSKVLIPYSDMIHLRRHFNSDSLLGDSNSALDPILEVSHTQNEGLVNSIKIGASIRGVLSYTSVANDQQLTDKRDQFIKQYLSMDNHGGVAVVDSKTNYTPLDSKPITIDETQLRAIENKIYNYLGIHRAIVNGSYTEDQWSSFYESTIEPIAIQLSLEFTNKCFTEAEQRHGNKIIFDTNRLQFSSNSTKIRLVSSLVPAGLLTINQALEVLNMPKINGEEGDKRLQTLNYVDLAQANKYQGVDKNEGNPDSGNSDDTKK